MKVNSFRPCTGGGAKHRITFITSQNRRKGAQNGRRAILGIGNIKTPLDFKTPFQGRLRGRKKGQAYKKPARPKKRKYLSFRKGAAEPLPF